MIADDLNFYLKYNHTGRLARYHNIMGLETIQVLDKLTSEIKFVFLHPTMVDRIAAMLNYFLKNLVGPQRKSFKVCFLGQPRRSSSVG